MRLNEIAGLLGTAAKSAAGLAALRLDAVRKRTREELSEVAKKLELAGVSKLTKDELAIRILEALRALAKAGSAAPGRAKAAGKAKASSKAAKAKAAAPGRAKGAAAERKGAPARARKPAREDSAPASPEEAALQSGEDPSATAKLDLGPAGRGGKPVETVPWSYGQDRVVAAAVDPDRLFVYWEATDPALERARVGLGPGGPEAWLNLRVYDTTDLIFDGTNAHSYFDHRVERSDRQWFFEIRRPTSTAHVDLGMKSSEGYFVTVARSGRVDFPRKEPSPLGEPEWLTVLPATGEIAGSATGGPRRAVGGGAPPGEAPPPPPFAPIALWRLHESGADREARIAELLASGWERVEWTESEGGGYYELQGRTEWQGPVTRTTWEAGPFQYPVEVEPPLREEWRGPAFAFKVGGVTHVVYGPWQVVIRNLDAHQGRAVLGQWEMYRSWTAEGGREVRHAGPGAGLMAGASEKLGASERRWLSGSELRLGGASELWRLGASEVRLGGASEVQFAGASLWMAAGASERRLLGASESRLGGASERLLGGASERLGGSERRLGASEARLGASGERLGYPKVEE